MEFELEPGGGVDQRLAAYKLQNEFRDLLVGDIRDEEAAAGWVLHIAQDEVAAD